MIDIINAIQSTAFAKKFNFSGCGPIAIGKRTTIVIMNATVLMKSDQDLE